MHYLYRYVCILNVFFFICVYGQLSAIKNLFSEPLFDVINSMTTCMIMLNALLTTVKNTNMTES